MTEMIELKCDNPYCRKVFYRQRHGEYYSTGLHYCSKECHYEHRHILTVAEPPSIFNPKGEIEEQFDVLMRTVCRKLAGMVDTNGNLREGADEYEWKLYNAIHNTLCDMVGALLARRGLTLGSSYDERTTHSIPDTTTTTKRKPRIRGKKRRLVFD